MGNTARSMQIVGGRPTAPDVERLLTAFAAITRDGQTLKHEDIERVLQEKRGTNRYRTVVGAWRRRLISSGIVLDGTLAPGVGFVVLKAGEMVEQYAPRKLEHGKRSVARAVKVAGLAPDAELTQHQRVKRDHAMLHYGAALSSLVGARKAIASLTSPPEVSPR